MKSKGLSKTNETSLHKWLLRCCGIFFEAGMEKEKKKSIFMSAEKSHLTSCYKWKFLFSGSRVGFDITSYSGFSRVFRFLPNSIRVPFIRENTRPVTCGSSGFISKLLIIFSKVCWAREVNNNKKAKAAYAAHHIAWKISETEQV